MSKNKGNKINVRHFTEEQLYHRMCNLVRGQNENAVFKATLAYTGVLIRSIHNMSFRVMALRALKKAVETLIAEQPEDIQQLINSPSDSAVSNTPAASTHTDEKLNGPV